MGPKLPDHFKIIYVHLLADKFPFLCQNWSLNLIHAAQRILLITSLVSCAADTSITPYYNRMSRHVQAPLNPAPNPRLNLPTLSWAQPRSPLSLPSNARRSVVDSHNPETGTSSPTTARADTIQVKRYIKNFNKLYDQFYRYDNVDQTLMDEVCGTYITMDLFDKITLGKQYQSRIALIDGKIRLDEIPLKPHGQIIGHLNYKITQMLGQDLPGALFMPIEDNGMSASTVTLIVKIFVSVRPVKSVPMLLGVSGSIDFPTRNLPGSKWTSMGSRLPAWLSRSQ